MSSVSGVFDGLKVVEFTHFGIGPLTGKYLADHGATVVRIESLSRPDLVRTSPPFKDGVPGINRSGFWTQINTSKYDISLNLSHPRGKEVAEKLVAWADVVVENFAPGVLKRLGLGYEDLVQIKPDIIMVSLTNLGQTGPYAGHPGTGSVAQAIAGLTNMLGWEDRGPANPFGAVSDLIAPRFATIAVLSALDHHRRTGQGQYLDISQFETTSLLLAPLLLERAANGREPGRMGNRDPHAAPHGVYPCLGDDRWVAVAACTEEEWQALGQVMGKPELAVDPRFATLEQRKQNEDELDGIVAAWTGQRSAEQAMESLQAAGVPAGVVDSPADLFHDPQLQHRRHFHRLDHPEIGPHSHLAQSFVLSETPSQIRRAPLLGEHNEYILKDILGMEEAEVVSLILERVLE